MSFNLDNIDISKIPEDNFVKIKLILKGRYSETYVVIDNSQEMFLMIKEREKEEGKVFREIKLLLGVHT